MPENARCPHGGNATISESDTSGTSATSTTKISNSKEEKTSITMSIATLDGGTTEPRGNPEAASSSSTSQWQTSWSSWQPYII